MLDSWVHYGADYSWDVKPWSLKEVYRTFRRKVLPPSSGYKSKPSKKLGERPKQKFAVCLH
jgi:hypothetical protein